MNDAPSAALPRYALSFTTGALLTRESVLLAPLYVEHCDWAKVRTLALEGNVLQVRTLSTGVRLVRETVQRLSALTDDEVRLLTEATSSERSYLLWVAACRRYELIGEFAEEVLRERFLLLTPTLDHHDFDSFVRSKALWHEELVEIKDSTLRKLRSNVFKMLQEAGLLSDTGHVTPALLSDQLTAVLNGHMPSDLRFFPIRQNTTGEGAL